MGHFLEPPRPDPADRPDPVELDPRPVVLVFDRDRAVVFELLDDRALLREHHPDGAEGNDPDRREGGLPGPGEERDLPEVVQRLLRMLDQGDIHAERQGDRVPDRSLADPDPELGEHEPGEVPGLEWSHGPEALLEEAHLGQLRLGARRPGHPHEERVHLGE